VGSGLELFDDGTLSGTPSFADATAPQPLAMRLMVTDGIINLNYFGFIVFPFIC
jgi:hypothetical protein